MSDALSEPLQLAQETRGSFNVARISGGNWLSGVEDVARQLLGSLTESAPNLVLDLAALHYVNTNGISLMLACDRRAHDLNGRLALVNPQPTVLRALHLMRVDDLLRIYASVDEAIEKLPREPR